MNEKDIENLIPHRERMRLPDTIIRTDETSAVCEATVKESWPMAEKGNVSPLVLIELIAQTSAVCIGSKERKAGNDPARGKGWLVGIKSADFFTEAIPLHTRIRSLAEIRFTLDNFTEIRGTAEIDGKTAGEIILQVMRSE